jgi:phytoene dehydrogenase-like protein
MLLYQAMGAERGSPRASRFVQGGAGKLAEALAAAAQQHGAEICTGQVISRIVVEDERAVGVITEAGERLARKILAGAVISSANPKHTFFDLAGPQNLGVSFVREIKNLRFRGGLARVNLALSGLPRFSSTLSGERGTNGLPHLSGHILICPDLENLERASDEAKYGNIPRRPVLDLAIPTLLDSTLAPPGCHLACINVQFVPYILKEGSWDERRSALGEQVLKTLGEVAPGIQDLVLHRQILTPLDLEREYGLAQGDIYHGEMALDQLFFMRPVPGFAQYRTPIEGLYLCGAGTHPGGGVTGAPGYNAAREVLRDLRKRSVV